MKRAITKTLKFLSLAIFVVGGGLLLLFAIPQTGLKALTVVTGSMRPTIPPGSLVLVRRVPNAQLHIGDVVTYINPRNTQQTITHRIIELKPQAGLPGFITKGDANNSADQPILGGNVVGKVIWHVGVVGRIVNWSKTPLGLALLLGIPGIIIILDEIQLLKKRLAEPEKASPTPPSQPLRPQDPARPRPAAQAVSMTPAPVPRSTDRPKRQGMDGIMRAIVATILMGLAVRSTQAMLVSNPVSLTGNRLTAAAVVTPSHLVIQEVWFQSPGLACFLPASGTINLGSTGPGSFNNAVVNQSCQSSTSNTNNVTVTNTNNQSSSSGSASSSGNTNGGGATSGSANNNNSTTTIVNIGNGGGATGQAVIIYNPTGDSVNLKNWKLSDASGGSYSFVFDTFIPSHGWVAVTQQIGNGLAPGGDRIILKNAASVAVDAASWGADTSQLNPSIATQVSTVLIQRNGLGTDSNTAADWLVVP